MPARWRSKAASLANRQTSRIGSPLNGERRSLRKISEERICVAGKERRQRGERPPQDHSRGADTDPNKVDHLGFLNERGKPYNPRASKPCWRSSHATDFLPDVAAPTTRELIDKLARSNATPEQEYC